MTAARTVAGIALLALLAFGLEARAGVVETYDYVPDRVYPVRTGLGIATQIELDADDKVVDYSSGFSSGWEMTRRDNVFYLKPRNVDVQTNLVVRTATRAYIFELQVVATDWKSLDDARRAGVQYKITFRYPSDATAAVVPDVSMEPPPGPGLDTRLLKERRYDFDYDYATRSRQRWLVPSAVYDDGRFTYLRMGGLEDIPSGDFPAVFGRERVGGEDFVVNTTVQGDVLVVHGTYPYLVIRHGVDVVGLRRSAPR